MVTETIMNRLYGTSGSQQFDNESTICRIINRSRDDIEKTLKKKSDLSTNGKNVI